MWFLANPSTQPVRDAMRDHANHLGMIATPKQGNKIRPEYPVVGFDNSVFGKGGKGYPGDDKFLRYLATYAPHARKVLFAVAPDRVGDAAGTLERSAPMFPRIRALGLPVALAAQNGVEMLDIPWDEFDVLFLGGGPECVPCGYTHQIPDHSPSAQPQPKRRKPERCPRCGFLLTEWKVGRAAVLLTREALRRRKRVHMGRVNSFQRLRKAYDMGCQSADGTYLTRGPDVNLPKLLGWLSSVNNQGVFWEAS